MRVDNQKSFIDDDFLLGTTAAQKLYHGYAKELPIIDYHNHLPPEDIAYNRKFKNITEVWLANDHYKWRAMRAIGIDEKYITGNASQEEKFLKWAECVKYTVRNPLFHWTHLELQRYFGITELLTKKNAKSIYEETSRQLAQTTHSTLGLLNQQKVETVCTTEDPLDVLKYHKMFKKNTSLIKMGTAFRPDKAFAVENTLSYLNYLESLEKLTNNPIKSFEDFLMSLSSRIAYFHENGCRLADHGLEYLPFYETSSFSIEGIFKKLLDNKNLNNEEVNYFKCETLKHLSKTYHEKGWVQQFHLGALRNVNSRLVKTIGVDSGFDSIGDFSQARTLGQFLNYLDKTDQLTKTILYNLNPAYNEVIATMTGNFNDGSCKGKIQYGSGWWFLDQKDGIEKQLNTLSNMGLISTFVGMLTDSRSFLSFPRHEYFRRILCNLFGDEVEKGELPNDLPYLGEIIQDICYNNAKRFFDFED